MWIMDLSGADSQSSVCDLISVCGSEHQLCLCDFIVSDMHTLSPNKTIWLLYLWLWYNLYFYLFAKIANLLLFVIIFFTDTIIISVVQSRIRYYGCRYPSRQQLGIIWSRVHRKIVYDRCIIVYPDSNFLGAPYWPHEPSHQDTLNVFKRHPRYSYVYIKLHEAWFCTQFWVIIDSGL